MWIASYSRCLGYRSAALPRQLRRPVYRLHHHHHHHRFLPPPPLRLWLSRFLRRVCTPGTGPCEQNTLPRLAGSRPNARLSRTTARVHQPVRFGYPSDRLTKSNESISLELLENPFPSVCRYKASWIFSQALESSEIDRKPAGHNCRVISLTALCSAGSPFLLLVTSLLRFVREVVCSGVAKWRAINWAHCCLPRSCTRICLCGIYSDPCLPASASAPV